MFVYDSDMEWDMGMPWYRPTRVNHATSGSEFGWRSGTGMWPSYYLDSLPAMVDIGPGSPVGVEFGYGAKFPAKYQKALYICDWTFGTMYAIHIEPDGSDLQGDEGRVPQPHAAAADGRVHQPGRRRDVLHDRRPRRAERAVPRHLRRQGVDGEGRVQGRAATPELRDAASRLEALPQAGGRPGEGGRVHATRYLKHQDRFIRYAARVALEHQPVEVVAGQGARSRPTPTRLIDGVVALARQGDKSLQPKLLASARRASTSRKLDRSRSNST